MNQHDRSTRRLTCGSGLALGGLCALALFPVAGRAQRTLHAVRDLTIDASKHDLSVVRELVVSSSGIIAVLQPQDMLIRFFSPTGRALGTFGRDGEGPGEFRSMGWAGWNGDTLHIEDSGIRRVTLVGSDRKLLRTEPNPVRVSPPPSVPLGAPLLGESAIVAVVGDGSYLLNFDAAGKAPRWVQLAPDAIGYSLLHVARDGRFIGTVANLSNHEPWCAWGSPAVEVPYCSHWVVGDGFAHAVASVATARGSGGESRYHLRVIGSEHGDTLIDQEYTYQPVAIPGRVVDSVRRRLTSQPRLAPAKKAVYDALPFPRFYPPIIRILVGMDASIWLEEYTTGPEHRWRIVDPKGAVRGIVTIPASVSLTDVRLDTAWGTDLDLDGLQDIVRFRVQ